jgi:hypothetical protein
VIVGRKRDGAAWLIGGEAQALLVLGPERRRIEIAGQIQKFGFDNSYDAAPLGGCC